MWIQSLTDAAIQLEDFYRELANPLLSNVKFDYVGEIFENGSITNKDFQTYFKGGEYIVAGQLSANAIPKAADAEIVIHGSGAQGLYDTRLRLCPFKPTPIPIEIVPYNSNINPTNFTENRPFLPHYPDFCQFPPVIPQPEPGVNALNNHKNWSLWKTRSFFDKNIFLFVRVLV